MNQIPEIVCDVLYYLSGYVHYRTDRFSEKTYKKMLHCQNQHIKPMSSQQSTIYDEEGWKHDNIEIEKRLGELVGFSKNFRHIRDAKPTQEEIEMGKLAVAKTI